MKIRIANLGGLRGIAAIMFRLGSGKFRDADAPIIVNGRFLGRPVTGVERYGREMIAALDALAAQGEGPALRILAPPGTPCDIPLQASIFETVGRGGGHLWEQFHLLRAAQGGTLISLANSGPVQHPRHLVVIHDAAPFRFPQAYGWRYRSLHKLLGLALARMARIGTVSHFSRGELVHFLGVKPESITVLPNGSDHLSRVAVDAGTLDRLKLTGQRYLLTVGSANKNKNLSVVLDAWQQLHAAGRTHGAVLVVAGAINTRIFAAVDKATLPDAIFVGRVSDAELAALYSHTVAFIFPSRYEGFGIPPLEAMTHNAQVLASDIAPVREVCADAARYFAPDDAQGLASLMAQVLADDCHDPLRQAAARERLAAFSWEASARALLAILRKSS